MSQETITVNGEAPDRRDEEHDAAAGDEPRGHWRAADRPELQQLWCAAARREHESR
jgi:hypothetical protein